MKKILIVDDIQQNLYLLQVLLSANGLQVEQAVNGAEALEFARRGPPDMIISDILMPVMDGYALCRAWKEDERLKNIPFVFYSATYTEPKDQEFALKLGADRFIIKPVEPEKFMAMILETQNDIKAGKLGSASQPIEPAEYYKEYNAALIRKLEDKMLQLEEANRILERDIAERKRAEEEQRESIALIDAVVENVPLMIFLKEAKDLRFVIFNRAGEDLLGYNRATLLGKNNLDLFPPEQAAYFMAKDREVLNGDAGMLDIPEEPILTAKKGQRLLHTRKVCIRGNDGTTKYLLGISEDITERKQAEEKQKKLEEQLRQSQKLEAIGQLSSGVAHDFNNLLGGIMGHAELLKGSVNSASGSAKHADVIISLCQKAAALTKQLLTFARKAPFELQTIDLNAFVKQVAGLMERTIDRRVEIAVDVPDQPAFISGDRNQLENALLNIAINARDAMPEGGSLSMTSEIIDLSRSALPEIHREVMEGLYVKISITDTGIGMSKEIKERIFEPFFTTKEIGKGTGLGLASVYGCVKQHNGHIVVESRVGVGTRFDLYFPIVESGPSAGQKQEVALMPGKGTLLVVDDDPVFHSILTDIFGPLGYMLRCCSNGIEAAEYYRVNKSAIDVVILDMNMPKMSGAQCFRRLKEINPHVRVIIASGYGDNSERDALKKEGVEMFIQKPYRAAELREKIEEMMADAS